VSVFKWFGWINYSPHTRVAAFAGHLREGRLMASRCLRCGHRSFPPRADCASCLGREFELIETGGHGKLRSFTTVASASGGFESQAPYTIGIVDLDEGGSALAWIGATVSKDSLTIGMPLELVPALREDCEEIHVFYRLELPGPTAARTKRAVDEKSETSPPLEIGRLS
jgi:uncharacterized OB-fold protein